MRPFCCAKSEIRHAKYPPKRAQACYSIYQLSWIALVMGEWTLKQVQGDVENHVSSTASVVDIDGMRRGVVVIIGDVDGEAVISTR